jgi:hypothetical protein
MNEKKRTILIEIITKNIKEGKISVSLLSNTLKGIQQVAFQIGKFRLEKDPSIPGPYPSMLKRELELFFIEAKSGSLAATLEFPKKEASLFPDFPDFAERVTEDMHNVILCVKNNNAEIIQKQISDPQYRKRILNELSPLIPQKKTDYEISFRFGDFPAILQVERPSDDQIINLIGPYEEVKKEKAAEAVIQARCLARLKEDGQLDKIIDVLNYELFEELDLRPYRTTEIQLLNRKFELSHEIACDVRKEDSLIIIEYEPLNIRAYNFSREETIKDFAEEFALIWDAYAKEKDNNLTSDAITLKKYLLALVKEVKKI